MTGLTSFITELRNYLYKRTESLLKQEDQNKPDVKESFQLGIKASKGWMPYINSLCYSKGWRHPFVFGAGMISNQLTADSKRDNIANAGKSAFNHH